ncbi:phage antirepressor Ant [Bacillus toyonensis]|uniref:phage antirepressor KilAC domain-containing protein n=1 Tax=Bacillus toyonensis TaxID=155322 RepID=UPI000BFD2620|nr:phage antirepressor KilAC domain-containing protein [Bacillus toyonensis]PHC44616.1 phage antirepressor Ant [Bacillus toyonensis]
MKQLQVFNHQEFGALEVIHLNGKEMFNLENVAWSLGYTKVAKGKAYLRKDRIEKVIQKADISVVVHDGQPYITEDGLYELIFESETQKAKQFRKWVTGEVLPSIRKHGAYITPKTINALLQDPDLIIGLASQLKQEQQARQVAEQTIKKQQPLVTFAEMCMQSENSLLVREVAKLASKNGIIIGEKKLWQQLREWKLVFQKKNEPLQKYVDCGYFETSQGVRETSKGALTWITMRVTPKGQAYIINRLEEMNCGIKRAK